MAFAGTDTLSAQVGIYFSGAPLSDSVYLRLVSAEVDTSLTLPSRFRLAFRDSDGTVIGDSGATLTLPVQLHWNDQKILDGEITAIDLEYGPEGRLTIIRGLDKSYKLMYGTQTRAYMEMTASDTVEQLIGDADVQPGAIDPTDITYPVLTQANVSPWVFIQQLAALSNRMAFADSNGSFHFVKEISTDAAPEPATEGTRLIPGQLAMGFNLVRIRASVSSAEQVSEVHVRGWDPEQMEAVVGSANTQTTMISTSEEPAVLAGTVGAKTFVDVSRSFQSQAEAESRAQAIAGDFGATFTEIEGEATAAYWLEAGTPFSLAFAGDPFDGKYVCTSARHVFEPANRGYTVWFNAGGKRDRSLLSLGSEPLFADAVIQSRVHGVVTGKVSSIKDPNLSGMVQVTFPWLDDDYVTDWCRVLQIGAGDGWGNIWMPEVNSEVLVAFDRGDPARPYVLGGLYNGIHKIAPQDDTELYDDGTGAWNQRMLQSRTHHTLYFNDDASSGCILLKSGDGKHLLKFDQTGSGTVTLHSDGDIKIEGQNVTITAQQNLQLAGQEQLSLKGPKVQVNAEAELAVNSSGTASVKADGPLSLSGAQTSINA